MPHDTTEHDLQATVDETEEPMVVRTNATLNFRSPEFTTSPIANNRHHIVVSYHELQLGASI